MMKTQHVHQLHKRHCKDGDAHDFTRLFANKCNVYGHCKKCHANMVVCLDNGQLMIVEQQTIRNTWFGGELVDQVVTPSEPMTLLLDVTKAMVEGAKQ